MKEKERPKKETAGGSDDIFNAEPQPENKNVTVSSGPYLETLPVAGMTAGEIRRKFKDRFDIDDEAAIIINGNDANEDTKLNAGEALMFVRHAGEKGGVVVEDTTATVTTPEGTRLKMKLPDLLARITPDMSTGPCILPTGVKSVLSRGPITLFIYEQAPSIQKFRWIAANSPRPYGPGTKYRDVRIALPYLIILSPFTRLNGQPQLLMGDECFFRNEPLRRLSDKLHFPALLNCSKFEQPTRSQALSWICTQYLKQTEDMASPDMGRRYAASFEAVRYCLLETGFNLSSENHEGNSWFNASKTIDKRISTIERWEEETKKDPMFVLDVNWIDTEYSVEEMANRIFNRYNASELTVRNSGDLERIIKQG